jgi:hypothetical protein
MERVLTYMTRPKIKMTRRVWALIALGVLILFRGPIGSLLTTLFNDILLLMWNMAGWIDKLLFGINPQ